MLALLYHSSDTSLFSRSRVGSVPSLLHFCYINNKKRRWEIRENWRTCCMLNYLENQKQVDKSQFEMIKMTSWMCKICIKFTKKNLYVMNNFVTVNIVSRIFMCGTDKFSTCTFAGKKLHLSLKLSWENEWGSNKLVTFIHVQIYLKFSLCLTSAEKYFTWWSFKLQCCVKSHVSMSSFDTWQWINFNLAHS